MLFERLLSAPWNDAMLHAVEAEQRVVLVAQQVEEMGTARQASNEEMEVGVGCVLPVEHGIGLFERPSVSDQHRLKCAGLLCRAGACSLARRQALKHLAN